MAKTRLTEVLRWCNSGNEDRVPDHGVAAASVRVFPGGESLMSRWPVAVKLFLAGWFLQFPFTAGHRPEADDGNDLTGRSPYGTADVRHGLGKFRGAG